MKDLVEYIVKSMVNNPDDVSVSEEQENGEVRLLLSVNPSDMGLVIGKNGQTIKAIRKLLTVRAMAENQRVYLQIEEPEGGTTKEVEETAETEPEESPSETDEN